MWVRLLGSLKEICLKAKIAQAKIGQTMACIFTLVQFTHLYVNLY